MMFDFDPSISLDDLPQTSLEILKDQLRDVEHEIGKVHGVKGRRAILQQIRSGRLVEDDLVAKWNGLFAVVMDWCKDTPRPSLQETHTQEGREQRPFCYLLLC